MPITPNSVNNEQDALDAQQPKIAVPAAPVADGRPGVPPNRDTARVDRPQRRSNFITFKNLSTPLITTRYLNINSLVSNYRALIDDPVECKFTINPDNKRLQKQANVWGRKIISMQNLDLRKILSSNQSKWLKLLEQCYIYSYYKCVLYPLFKDRVAEFSSNTACVFGHVILYEFLNKPSYTFIHNEQYVRYSFSITDDSLTQLINKAKTFSYIKDYIIESPRFYLENTVLDRCLDGLRRSMDSSCPKMYILQESNNIRNQLTQDNFPVCNSFYSQTYKETNWFYCYSEDISLLDPKMLFGKACFICTLDDTESTKYFEYNTNDDNNYLVKYEVQALAGTSYPNYVSGVK